MSYSPPSLAPNDEAPSAPVAEPEPPARRRASSAAGARIVGLDIARGLAVLGMFGAHIGVTGLFDWGQPDTWLDLVNGRASILFATLAGVSVAILSGRTAPLDGLPLMQSRVRILIRAALIFAIGGLLQPLGIVAVILPMYAALFVISLPFLRWGARRLFIAAGVTAIMAPVVLNLIKTFLILDSSAFIDLMLSGVYPGLIWMAFLFAGMAIGRLDVTRLAIQLRLLVVGVVLAAVAYSGGYLATQALFPSPDMPSESSSSSMPSEEEKGAPAPTPADQLDLTGMVCDDYGDGTYTCYPDPVLSKESGGEAVEAEPAAEPAPTLDFSSLVLIDAHSGTPFEIIGSGGFAMALIALCLLAARVRIIRRALYPVASVGAMALTAYSAHIVAIAVLGEYATARIDNWPYLWFMLVALVLCTLWVTFLGRGPLERLLSWVSKRTAKDVTNPATPERPAGAQLDPGPLRGIDRG